MPIPLSVIKMTEEKEKKVKIELDDDDKHDVEELERVLNVVSEKVPALLNALTDVLYGKEQSAKYATAIATFYKSLVDAGMSKDQAFELTKEYMENLNIAGALGKVISHARDSDDEEIDKMVKEKVKEKIAKKLDEKLGNEEKEA